MDITSLSERYMSNQFEKIKSTDPSSIFWRCHISTHQRDTFTLSFCKNTTSPKKLNTKSYQTKVVVKQTFLMALSMKSRTMTSPAF